MTGDGRAGAIRVAVVTGGHSFDVPDFHRLFRSLRDVEACIQHMDDFASSPEEVRRAYDVVCFYHWLLETPTDDGLPWYCGKPRTALEALGETDQGILVLHHAILAYPLWPLWDELVGIAERSFQFHHGQQLHVEVAAADHPITRGLSSWDVTDETYDMADAREGSEILLTVDHPRSMRTIAWTRTFRNSRVFCLELGHDKVAYADSNFREVIRRGIVWCARRKRC